MGARQSAVAPEPRAPRVAHRRADGPAQARMSREVSRCRLQIQHGDSRGAPWNLSDVSDDFQNSRAAAKEDLCAARAPQIEIESGVSVIGTEFGWAEFRARARKASPPAPGQTHANYGKNAVASHAGKDGAAGVNDWEHVIGHESPKRANSRNSRGLRSGRDSAMELRRFMESRAGEERTNSGDDSDEIEDCIRSPALLQDAIDHQKQKRFSGAERRKVRSLAAPGGRCVAEDVDEGGSSLEMELRREIEASKARTKLLST